MSLGLFQLPDGVNSHSQRDYSGVGTFCKMDKIPISLCCAYLAFHILTTHYNTHSVRDKGINRNSFQGWK